MIRTLFNFVFTLIIILALAVIGLNIAGGPLVASFASSALGAPVQVDRIILNPFASHIGIKGLVVKNPSGFKEEKLLSLPEISIRYDLPAIFGGTIHIPEIIYNFEEITVEKNAAGSVNLLQLTPVKEMQLGGGKEEPAPAPSEPGKPSRPAGKALALQIDRVDLTLGRGRYVDSAKTPSEVREFNLNVQHKIMENVTSSRQIIREVVTTTMQKLGMTQLLSGLGDLGAPVGQAQEALKEGLGSLKGKIGF